MKNVLLLVLVGVVIVAVPASAVWQDRYQFPEDDWVTALWVCSETSVYVGTTSGSLYHWNGLAWTLEDCPVSGSVDNIHGLDDGFVVVNSDSMFYWRDNGEWNEIRLISQERHSSITGNSREEFYISVDDQIRHYQNGQWIKILTPASANPYTEFQSIHLTRENELYVVGITYSCDWYQVPVGGWWVYSCWPNAPSCYRRNGDRLEPFLNTSQVESGLLVGGHSVENLYFYNGYSQGFGSDSRIIHHNGEFFTLTALKPMYGPITITSTQADNNLFFFDGGVMTVWEGLIPRKMPVLPELMAFGNHLDGIGGTDFWVSGDDRTIHHWVGPLPEVPAATGAFLKMDDYRVHAGEPFHVQVAAGNATDEVVTGDVYVCMMIFGMNGLWFWPNWTTMPSQIEPMRVTLEPHSFQYFEVFDLVWPDIDATIDGLFHSIMVTDTGEISEFQSIGFSVR